MEEKDYPYIYFNSNQSSLQAQKSSKRLSWLTLGVMLVSIIMTSLSKDLFNHGHYYDKINGILVLAAAIISTVLLIKGPEKNWYLGRAVAESIKTLSWRFIMHSEPFLEGNIVDDTKFQKRIMEIFEESQKAGFTPDPSCPHSELITQKMIEIRNYNFLERKDFYATHRIQEQANWYKNKSQFNKKKATLFSSLIIALQALAATYLILIIDSFNQIDLSAIFIFLATSLITIMEVNKYKELHQSYFLTMTELNFIRNRFNTVQDDKELDEFVTEAEQAISREHTMWLARRGNSNYLINIKKK